MVAALAFALLPLALAQSAQPATTAAGSVTQAVVAGGASTSLSIGSIQATPTGLGPQGFTIPPVASITSGAPTDATVALDTTFTAGAQPSALSNVPALPNLAQINPANYPALDQIPPTNSSEVQGWLAQIDMSKVPNYGVTDGTCAGTPGAITDGRCWWTCGGCTRETDITQCPDKGTWGTSFDDGPSPFTPLLLDYLNEQKLKTTFFLVGSRVISRPEMVQTEYMTGHQLAVHTWSHPSLTTLTNEQIVAELGWTKKVIKDVTGVTPNTWRPPYGDIDDRVRAIAAQMGLTPIIWTSVTTGGQTVNFDTTDWNIPGGKATGQSSLSKFNQILKEYVPLLKSGFIVLEHDLYQQTVDLAVGYFLPQAINSGNYTLKSIVNCLGLPLSEAYIETSSNTTTTQIKSAAGGSTYFQPIVGSQTGSAVIPSSGGGASATGGTGGSGGNGGASGGGNNAAASQTSRGAGEKMTVGWTVLGAGVMAALAAF